MNFRHFILLPFLFFISCSTPEEKTADTRQVTEENNATPDEFDGPPFDDTCNCSFAEFGNYKTSPDQMHIYKSGKGWDPAKHSCSWVWGEDINNIFPDDSTIKILQVHLLDLDKFSIPENQTVYGHDSIKKYVIAVYTNDRSKGTAPCVFDPFETGKYPKPAQWVE